MKNVISIILIICYSACASGAQSPSLVRLQHDALRPSSTAAHPRKIIPRHESIAHATSPEVKTGSPEKTLPIHQAHIHGRFMRLFDISIASIAIVPSLLLICVSALLIRLNDSGPVFFVQKRMGFLGEEIAVPKLRTMSEDAQVTRVGRILRRMGIDELPQLWLVLTGKMSIFGPRPLSMREFGDKGHIYVEEVLTKRKPGMFGIFSTLWGPDKGQQPLQAHLILEQYEIEHWSVLWMAKIVLATLHAIIYKDGIEERMRFLGIDIKHYPYLKTLLPDSISAPIKETQDVLLPDSKHYETVETNIEKAVNLYSSIQKTKDSPEKKERAQAITGRVEQQLAQELGLVQPEKEAAIATQSYATPVPVLGGELGVPAEIAGIDVAMINIGKGERIAYAPSEHAIEILRPTLEALAALRDEVSNALDSAA